MVDEKLDKEPEVVAATKPVVMDGMALRPFIEHLDNNSGPRWTGYLRELMRACKMPVNVQSEWLLHYGGSDIQRLNSYLPKLEEEEDRLSTSYEKLISRLNRNFTKKIIYVLQRSKLRAMEPGPSERIESFVIRLREQGSTCNYGDKIELVIVDQVLATCRNGKLKE